MTLSAAAIGLSWNPRGAGHVEGGSASVGHTQPSSSFGFFPASTFAANQPGLRSCPDQVTIVFSGYQEDVVEGPRSVFGPLKSANTAQL